MSKAGRKKQRRLAGRSRRTPLRGGQTTGQERDQPIAGTKPGDRPTDRQGTQR